jgi:hypothetical protein
MAIAAASLGVVAAPTPALADSVVTNTAGFGPGSLRAAVDESNSSPDADTITFASGVTGTINLASSLSISYATTIDGPGANAITVSSPSQRPIFFNPIGASPLEIEGITLTGSQPGASGGAVGAFCTAGDTGVTLRDVTITGSSASNGGGVASNGCDLSLVSTTITGSTATAADGDGGAIHLTDAPGGGAAGLLSIVDSRISGNKAGDDGAGVFANAPAAVQITRSVVSGSQQTAIAPSCACGGGVTLDETGPVTIDSSTFSGNTADAGGGVFVAEAAAFAMRSSTVTANSGQGGGLYFENDSGAPFTVANSTIAGNSAGDSEGGGVYLFGSAGEDLALSSTIIAGNTADDDPDIHNASSGAANILVDHSLVGQAADVLRLVEAAPGTNKLDTGAIELGPLADNGGPTPTMLPALGGPAIDAGVANGLATDQRGLARTVNQPLVPNASTSDGTDIGAVEATDGEISGARLQAKKKQKQKGKKIKVVVKAGADEPVVATASGIVKLGKKKLTLTKPKKSLDPGATAKLKLKPKGKRAAKKIGKALARGKKAKASVNVEFTDGAGNRDRESAKVKLVG